MALPPNHLGSRQSVGEGVCLLDVRDGVVGGREEGHLSWCPLGVSLHPRYLSYDENPVRLASVLTS